MPCNTCERYAEEVADLRVDMAEKEEEIREMRRLCRVGKLRELRLIEAKRKLRQDMNEGKRKLREEVAELKAALSQARGNVHQRTLELMLENRNLKEFKAAALGEIRIGNDR